ncbi:Hypothetical_protein [Hexamita inflata]|uniref:Hypothetical_protein n=1 Tax=Hexamita inflata TaxID=28002 RepID=A0AA86U7F8_9EUKA|nr:Hypothetical protein HINF_LOCUS33555 [Hexamita inflata]
MRALKPQQVITAPCFDQTHRQTPTALQFGQKSRTSSAVQPPLDFSFDDRCATPLSMFLEEVRLQVVPTQNIQNMGEMDSKSFTSMTTTVTEDAVENSVVHAYDLGFIQLM